MAKKREQPEERAVYIISVAAELAGVHPQTLRIYERKGLLRPARTPGNTRRYSQRDIARLQMIQKLTQEQGLNLAGVKMLEEMERLRSQSRRGEIVPLSSVRRVQIQVERAKASPGPKRQGPIAVGPGSD